MYLYRPLWVQAVRGWSTLLVATLSIASLLAAFAGAGGLLSHPGVVGTLIVTALMLSAVLWAYLWAVTEQVS